MLRHALGVLGVLAAGVLLAVSAAMMKYPTTNQATQFLCLASSHVTCREPTAMKLICKVMSLLIVLVLIAGIFAFTRGDNAVAVLFLSTGLASVLATTPTVWKP
jgi:Zn-dependent protease with chaperone function